MIEPVTGSIVLTAENFNPSIFSQLWFVQEGLFAAGDFQGPSMSTPDLAQHVIGKMRVLVIPPKLDFSFPPDDELSGQKACETVRKVSELLPHTPFQALGLNCIYSVRFESVADVPGITGRLFFPSDSPLRSEFASGDSRFGGYFSKDIFGARLRLDIKPGRQDGESSDKQLLTVNFNLHTGLQLPDKVKRLQAISERLEHWSAYHAKCLAIVETISKAVDEGRAQ